MGTGWRRAFCTTIPRNSSSSVLGDVQQNPNPNPNPSPRTSSSKLAFFKSSGGSSGSNPSTPRLQSNWSLRSRNSNNGGSGGNEDNNDDDDLNNLSSNNPPLRLLRPKTIDKSNSGEFQSSVIDNLNITPRLRCKTNTKKVKSSLLGSNPSSPRSPFSIFKSSLGFSRSNCGLCLQSVKTGHKTAIFTAECSHTFHFPCISNHIKKEKLLECPICKSTWRDASFLAINNLQSNNNVQIDKKLTEISNSTPKSNLDSSRSKPYDDDEPLRTPRFAVAGAGAVAGGGILPIPEAINENEENEENDVDSEFKGFFVNPIPSSTSDEFRRDLKSVEVTLMAEVALISSFHSHDTYAVVLKVKAPPPAYNRSQSRRAPIDLVAVLDVSLSMGGAKLQMLKRAMRLVISSLGSADRLSILAFSASPKRLLPLRRMTSKGQRSARRIVDQLTVSRGTSAGEALRKATKVLEDRRERNPVASIILLSDGHDERVTDNDNNSNNNKKSNQRQSSSHVSSTRFAHVEIPVHTLEKTGGFSQHANDPVYENAFTKCVGGLLSVVAQDLRIQLGVAPGSDPAEITAVYSCNGKPTVLDAGSVRFGDLYAEEEREVLVEMRVPRGNNNGSHHVLSARCSYNDPATQEAVYGGEKALLVGRAQTVRSSSCSPKIERLRNLFIATRAVAESRLLVEHNKLTMAHHLLSSAKGLLMQSLSANEFVKGIESELIDVEWRVQYQHQSAQMVDENGDPLTPTSAWRAAEKLAKVAVMKKSLNRVGDLHGFENARF